MIYRKRSHSLAAEAPAPLARFQLETADGLAPWIS